MTRTWDDGYVAVFQWRSCEAASQFSGMETCDGCGGNEEEISDERDGEADHDHVRDDDQ